MKAALVLVLACGLAGAWSGASAAKPRPQTGNGIEAAHSAAWPAVPAQLAKNIAKASFAHDYHRVWAYLHPSFRHAVSESHWRRCQGAHPAAPPRVTITQVSVASATQVPVQLSLLGRENVQEIQLLVRFKTAAATQPQAAVMYTFWLKQGGKWTAVWPSEEYRAYEAGGCYVTPQGPPLY